MQVRTEAIKCTKHLGALHLASLFLWILNHDIIGVNRAQLTLPNFQHIPDVRDPTPHCLLYIKGCLNTCEAIGKEARD